MTYNNNRIVCTILSIIGLIDSLYLTWMKITQNQALCLRGVGDCWSVNTSQYSKLFGIPVAVYGIASYGIILAVLLFESKIGSYRAIASYFLFGISLFGTIYSLYLTYLELAIIKAICPFCILSAVTMTILLILIIIRLNHAHDGKIAY